MDRFDTKADRHIIDLVTGQRASQTVGARPDDVVVDMGYLAAANQQICR